MILFQTFQHIPVKTAVITRINQSCVNAVFLKAVNHLPAQPEEAPQRQNGNAVSPADDLITVKRAVITFNRQRCGRNLQRYPDDNRMLPLFQSPVQHGQIFLFVGGCQADNVRDVGNQGNVKTPEMSDVHTGNRSGKHQYDSRIVIDCQVLRQLVVGSLDKGTPYAEDRLAAAFGQSRSHSDGVFLGDADIDIVLSEQPSSFRSKAESSGGSGSENDDVFVFFDFFIQKVKGYVVIVLSGHIDFALAAGNVKRNVPVPFFLVFLSKLISFAF